ncbi:hypothetical protein LFZ14_07550 [Salmonella enterica subsp. enterica serovar Hillingdon str. N1529-D3]|nr:hypothetical protein LFZ14_07550 [Salmonella enterica subsp. enterica serovar Hillingdon str. N1529-D3]
MRAITFISKSKPASQVTPTAVQIGMLIASAKAGRWLYD